MQRGYLQPTRLEETGPTRPKAGEGRASTGFALFCLLCLWGATRWLLPAGESWGVEAYAVLAAGSVLAAVYAWAQAWREPAATVNRGVLVRAASGGACLLTGMQVPFLFGVSSVRSTERSVALALCPVVIAVVQAASRDADAPDLPGRLWPPLAGVAGLLLLLPEPSFADWKQIAALAAMPLLAGTGAALLGNTRLRGGRLRAVALSGACVPALLALAVSALVMHGESSPFAPGTFLLAAGAEGVSGFLAVAVISRLGGQRWSASLVIIPLLVALEGILMLHPAVGGRGFLGMGLLALAALFLLRKPEARAG